MFACTGNLRPAWRRQPVQHHAVPTPHKQAWDAGSGQSSSKSSGKNSGKNSSGKSSSKSGVLGMMHLLRLFRLGRARHKDPPLSKPSVRDVFAVPSLAMSRPSEDAQEPSYTRCQRPDSGLSQWSEHCRGRTTQRPPSCCRPSVAMSGRPLSPEHKPLSVLASKDVPRKRSDPWEALRKQQRKETSRRVHGTDNIVDLKRRADVRVLPAVVVEDSPLKPDQVRSQCSQFKARARRLPTPMLMDSLKRCARRLYVRTRLAGPRRGLRTPSLASSENTWASSASRRRRRRRKAAGRGAGSTTSTSSKRGRPPAVRLDGKAVLLGTSVTARMGAYGRNWRTVDDPPKNVLVRRALGEPKTVLTARLWLKFFELRSDARAKGLRNDKLLADFRDDLKTEHMWRLVRTRLLSVTHVRRAGSAVTCHVLCYTCWSN